MTKFQCDFVHFTYPCRQTLFGTSSRVGNSKNIVASNSCSSLQTSKMVIEFLNSVIIVKQLKLILCFFVISLIESHMTQANDINLCSNRKYYKIILPEMQTLRKMTHRHQFQSNRQKLADCVPFQCFCLHECTYPVLRQNVCFITITIKDTRC